MMVINVVTMFIYVTEGLKYMPQITTSQREKAASLLKQDAELILRLIEVQIDNLMTPQCPLYDEVLDTQMFGLSREIDFAVRLEMISAEEGRELLDNLEYKLSELHEAKEKEISFEK